MKNTLHIALAIAFVLSGVALSSAQTRPTVSAPRIIRFPSGNILIIRTPPSIPPLKQPAVFKPLPSWATTPPLLVTSPFPPRPLPTPSKPISIFGNPLPPKVKPFKDWNKFLDDQRKIDMARTVRSGEIEALLPRAEEY